VPHLQSVLMPVEEQRAPGGRTVSPHVPPPRAQSRDA
jgi:hypothetical protein